MRLRRRTRAFGARLSPPKNSRAFGARARASRSFVGLSRRIKSLTKIRTHGVGKIRVRIRTLYRSLVRIPGFGLTKHLINELPPLKLFTRPLLLYNRTITHYVTLYQTCIPDISRVCKALHHSLPQSVFKEKKSS